MGVGVPRWRSGRRERGRSGRRAGVGVGVGVLGGVGVQGGAGGRETLRTLRR